MNVTWCILHAQLINKPPVAARCNAWSATVRLLGLRVRIPPEAWMSVVSVVCCQVDAATG
jgi:hypothetical protein